MEGRAQMRQAFKFTLRIDAFTPESLPMRRLAQYLLGLAQLMGEPEHVHFDRIS